ncbi:hypothetical protein M378DRAFT_303498 [Amanita muscaria Koide BX008]|uniref:Uncharacterized protein n=1 Tax=Amanita muscaria (strain Koide BX008) TaxID=946122 RepID=A0A0C2XD45_AMAMK|nr:hypothetical protein M378DRAFT_303498 [Amanita muscaria Koide BX008]
MNVSLHDSGKKTSINALLNPEDVPSLPPPLSDTRTQPPHHYNGSKPIPPVHDSFHQGGNSFSLRKAEWGDGGPRPGRLPTENNASIHHSRYQDQPSLTGVSVGYQNPTHDSHLSRQRYDDHARYPARGQSWEQGASGTPHVPKHPAPRNSSEHGGGYPPQHFGLLAYPQPCQQNGVSEQHSLWQASGRESAHLLARGTGPHEQHQYPYAHYPTINSRNGPASYYRQPSTSGVYATPIPLLSVTRGKQSAAQRNRRMMSPRLRRKLVQRTLLTAPRLLPSVATMQRSEVLQRRSLPRMSFVRGILKFAT